MGREIKDEEVANIVLILEYVPGSPGTISEQELVAEVHNADFLND